MADTTEANEAKISIKVIVDKVKKRVVYAEADHSFVDILFSFMTLPMGTIVRLLRKLADDNKFEPLGSLNNLYQSLNDFPKCYLAKKECKSMLLNPRSLSYDLCRSLELNIDDTEPMEYFTCKEAACPWHRSVFFFTGCNTDRCRRDRVLMDQPVTIDSTILSVGRSVFVSSFATFIVTDDLCVIPYTLADSIRLLKDLGITDMSRLEERYIDMGSEQILYLLKMALSLDSPLTHLVFGRNKPIRRLDSVCQSLEFNMSNWTNQETFASSKFHAFVFLQKSTGKVLFAEAREDFVDFLFGFLSIPLGTVIGTLLNGSSSMGCMDNLFKSISNMSVERYFKSQAIRDILLTPHFGQRYVSKNQLFPLEGIRVTGKVAGFSFVLKDPEGEEEYLKQSGMFFVTDDLVITPSSSHSTMGTLIDLKVQLDDIERCEVSIGLEEGLRILKASLRSTSTLTSIIEHQLKK